MLLYSLYSCVGVLVRPWAGLAGGCGAVAFSIGGGFIPVPSGSIPGLLRLAVRAACRLSGGPAVLSAPKRNLRKRAPPGRYFSASGRSLVCAAWHAACWRAASALVLGPAALRVSPALGWCGFRSRLVSWLWWVVCVRLCVGGAGVTRCAVWSLAAVRWPRTVEGALCLRRPVFGGRSGRGRKMAKSCSVVAVWAALGVPFCGRSRCSAQAGRSHRTAPARGGARQRPINSTIENTITRFFYG